MTMMTEMRCRKCGGNVEEVDGYLERVNPLGELPPVWECRPDCDPLGLRPAPPPTERRGDE